MMWVSMAATGHLHELRIRMYGEKGSLEWVQEQPNELILRSLAGPQRTLTRGSDWLSPATRRAWRLWPGHPEGYLEAFANIYTDIADVILARRNGTQADPLAYLFPTIEDGVRGVNSSTLPRHLTSRMVAGYMQPSDPRA
jgi:predicted dehydrogenase